MCFSDEPGPPAVVVVIVVLRPRFRAAPLRFSAATGTANIGSTRFRLSVSVVAVGQRAQQLRPRLKRETIPGCQKRISRLPWDGVKEAHSGSNRREAASDRNAPAVSPFCDRGNIVTKKTGRKPPMRTSRKHSAMLKCVT